MRKVIMPSHSIKLWWHTGKNTEEKFQTQTKNLRSYCLRSHGYYQGKNKSSGIMYKLNSYYKEQEHDEAIWCKQLWLGGCSAWATRSNMAVLLLIHTRAGLETAASTQGTVLCHRDTLKGRRIRTKLVIISKWVNMESRT